MLIGLGSTQSVQQMIVQAANQYGVPPAIALGIAAHESGFNPNATNKNTNGTTDWGVMQLNDTTVKTLGVTNPLDPQQNIDAGVSLLAKYLQQYNGDETKALWAYASGPGAVTSGNQNSTAAQFISCVTAYGSAGNPGCNMAAPDPAASADTSGTDSLAIPGLDLSTALTDFGSSFSSGDFSGMSGSDWLVIGGGLALVMFLGYQIMHR